MDSGLLPAWQAWSAPLAAPAGPSATPSPPPSAAVTPPPLHMEPAPAGAPKPAGYFLQLLGGESRRQAEPDQAAGSPAVSNTDTMQWP